MSCRAGPPLPHYQRYNKEELSVLLGMAAGYASSFRGEMKPCPMFCRDKSEQYFATLPENVMEKYSKDNHGDPRNPVNGRLDGLFFAVNNVRQKTGTPPKQSIYGAVRLSLPAACLVKHAPNLYFSDFYCINRNSTSHYVQIVMTQPGSEADEFCSENLIRLNIRRNPFFVVEGYLGSDPNSSWHQPIRCRVTTSVWVEMFFTESIQLSRSRREVSRVRMIGKRTGGNMGLRKNHICEICNSRQQFSLGHRQAIPLVQTGASSACDRRGIHESSDWQHLWTRQSHMDSEYGPRSVRDTAGWPCW